MFGREGGRRGRREKREGGKEGSSTGTRHIHTEVRVVIDPVLGKGTCACVLKDVFARMAAGKKVVGRESRWEWGSFLRQPRGHLLLRSLTSRVLRAARVHGTLLARVGLFCACSPSLFLSFSTALQKHLLSGHRRHATRITQVCSLKLCASSVWDSDFTIAAVTCTEDRPDVTAGCSVTLSEL